MREVFLPVAVSADIFLIFVDISVDDVVPIGSAERGKEGECKHLFVLTKKPRIRFAARETGAVDSGLLSRANADCLPVECVANRVRLRVFERNQGDQQVADGGFGKFLVFGHDVLQKSRRNFKVVSALFKGDSKDLLALGLRRYVQRVDLHDVVVALPLGFQDFQSLGVVSGCNDSVRNFPTDQLSRGNIARI